VIFFLIDSRKILLGKGLLVLTSTKDPQIIQNREVMDKVWQDNDLGLHSSGSGAKNFFFIKLAKSCCQGICGIGPNHMPRKILSKKDLLAKYSFPMSYASGVASENTC